ncbi:hypothetical protein ABMA57_00060 [Saccharospirillum sp. HFRX-1]|uniref:hypothetical protein n=1 Tax=unclassified Saccharospirillum TaxID=2633430 RepID=UPI00371D2BA1
MKKLTTTLLTIIGFSAAILNVNAAELSKEVYDLSSAVVGNAGRSSESVAEPTYAPSELAIAASNPSYDSTTVTVGARGNYYIGYLVTTAPFASTIDGVEFSLQIYGIDSADEEHLLVYFCRGNGTNCRQFIGEGNITTDSYDGTATWAGGTELSPGWEVWVGVEPYDGQQVPMTQFSVDAAVWMGWEE